MLPLSTSQIVQTRCPEPQSGCSGTQFAEQCCGNECFPSWRNYLILICSISLSRVSGGMPYGKRDASSMDPRPAGPSIGLLACDAGGGFTNFDTAPAFGDGITERE